MNVRVDDFHARVDACVQRFHLLDGVVRLGVAFSGGPDSAALLLALVHLRPDLDICACHVDHGMHTESVSAARTAEVIALGAGVACVTVHANWAQGTSKRTEAGARAVRYRALERLCADMDLDALAVGHTRDDRAETVLLNLVRGAGLDGLSSMRPRRRLGSRALVRPLLEVGRDDTHAYCRARGVTPVVDPTNADTARARNKLRADVMPVLEDVHGQAAANIAGAASRLDADRAVLQSLVDRELASLACSGLGWVAFDMPGLSALPGPLAARVVREGLRPLLSGHPPGAEAVDVVLGARGGSLPGTRLTARAECEEVVVLAPVDDVNAEPVVLPRAGVAHAFGLRLGVHSVPDGRIEARRLRRGDRVPGGSRTLPDLLARAGIPRRERERALTVLVDGQPAAAIGPGFRVPRDCPVHIDAAYFGGFQPHMGVGRLST